MGLTLIRRGVALAGVLVFAVFFVFGSPALAQADETASGSVRLAGGSSALEGRVELFLDGRWGTVCDDHWDNRDAAVVCRQLGHYGGQALHEAHFGRGNGPIFRDDVQCIGAEARLVDCLSSRHRRHNCNHGEDAGVRCSASNLPPAFTTQAAQAVAEDTTAVVTLEAPDPESDPVTFAIAGGADRAQFTLDGAQLAFVTAPDYEAPADANGDNIYEVTVEVSERGVVADSLALRVTVTDDNEVNDAPVFTTEAAHSVVENLKKEITLSARDADGDPVSFAIAGGADAEDFELTGTRLALRAVPNYEAPADANGDNIYEVTVEATDGHGGRDTLAVTMTVTNLADERAPGSVRLAGGSSALEGRVELFLDGRWGTVCDDNWDNRDAAVVCRQLGHHGGQAVSQAHFGRGSGPIFRDDVMCIGAEARLVDCLSSRHRRHNCNHGEDAGVICAASEMPSGSAAVQPAVNGNTLTMTFARRLASQLPPAGSAFKVRTARGGESTRAITGTGWARIADATATVTLAQAVQPGDTVTVSYARQQNGSPLRDSTGREVADFSDVPARNEIPAPAPAVQAVEIVPGAGSKTIEAAVKFSAPVKIEQTAGAPTLALIAGGTVRRAAYASGSGTARLVFAYAPGATDGSPETVRVAASGLRLNGGAIMAAADGTPALLGFGEAPGVTGVAVAEKADGRWEAGDTVSVTLRFAEPVTVEGAPSLALSLGGVERRASYTRGSGSGALSFAYTLVEADGGQSYVRLVKDSLSLGGGSIRSAGGGLAAALAHPGAERTRTPNQAPVVDEGSQHYATFTASGNAPRGMLVTKDFEGMFSDPDGDALTYTVALADPGQAGLVEMLHVLTAEELAASPHPEVVAHLVWFRTDAEADWDTMTPAVPDPVSIRATLTATDPEGLSASVEGVFLTHWGPPRVKSVAMASNAGNDDTYGLGDTIRVAVRFDDPVTVDTSGGAPRLAIDMDPADWGRKWASYESGSGTAELVFAHEVAEPNYSSQGIAVLADTLELNGGGIHLASAHLASVTDGTAAALGHAGLGHDPRHKVDWQGAPAPDAPEATGVAVVSDAGSDDTYGMGDVIRVAVAFGEAVTVTGRPSLAIDMEPAPWGEKRAVYESGSGTARLVFAHEVVEPNYSVQGIAVLADTLALEGGAIRSASGADVALAHAGLGHDVRHKVDWRPALSVADAAAEEGADAAVEFAVSLSRAFANAAHAVTVDYATADGTATAGEDYTAASGTLTFAAGETSKTVRVALLDDGHDEGEETFTLRLSNAKGARIADGEATGTIANSDPLQKLWLARFGRTVAVQMVEALEGRFAIAQDAAPRMALTMAGRTVDLSRMDDDGALAETMTGLARAFGAPDASAANDNGPFARHGVGGVRNEGGVSAPARPVTGRELLLGSSFHFTTGAASGLGGAMTGWGKVLSGGSSSSSSGGLSFASETATGVLGMDWERDRLLVGVALSRSVETGSASFAQTGSRYDIEGRLSMVTPYMRVRAGERLSFWSAVGSGSGSLSLTHGGGSQTADLAVRLAAAGGRAALLQPGANGGLALALKTDAFFVRSESERVSTPGVGNLAAATGDASRLRAVMEGSRSFALTGGGALEPSLSLGLRHDGGDAETGTGVELGGRVAYADPVSGLSLEAGLRALVAHEETGYEEWGASGALRLVPGARGRGLSFSLAPTYGAPSSGVERLWSARGAQGLSPGGGAFKPESRLQGELGYGLPAFGGGFTGTPNLGIGLSGAGAREYRIGWRLTSVVRGDPGFEVSLDATRSEPANDNGAAAPAEHDVTLRAGIRW